jgi:hypothetical protein
VQTTDAQVRKLMKEIRKSGNVGQSALRSGMSRNTATKYVKLGKLPSELKSPRRWRTRPDPFEEEWAVIVQRLRDAPELEAKALFEDLLERYPDRKKRGHSSFLLMFAGLTTGFYGNMVLCQEPHELPSEGFAVTF